MRSDLRLPDHVGTLRFLAFVRAGGLTTVAAPGDDRHAFGAVCVAGVNILTAQYAAAVHEKLASVGIGVFHRICIEILVHTSDTFGACFVMAAAQSLSLDGPLIFHPGEMVDNVNVEVAEVASAGPDEAVEALHLIHQVTDARRLGRRGEESDWSVHAVAALQNNLTDLAVLETFLELLQRPAVAGHQSHADFEVLLVGFLGELEHPPARWAVHGDRLFHKNVEPLFDGVGEMHPTERRRCGKNRNVARIETIHCFLIRIETNEPAILGHLHLPAVPFFQPPVTAGEPMFEHIAHRDKLHRNARNRHSIRGRTCAPAAAADQRQFDGITTSCIETRGNPGRDSRRCGNATRILQKLAT